MFPAGLGGGGLSDLDLRRLREAAGPAPRRLAQHERAPRSAMTQQADNMLAELEAGAAQDELVSTGSNEMVLQRLLLVQTLMPAQFTSGKPRSPLEAAPTSAGAKKKAA